MRRILELDLELVKHMSFHCAPQISKFINRLYLRVDVGNQMKGDEVIAVTCTFIVRHTGCVAGSFAL